MHRNASLTPKGREVLIQRLQAGQRVTAAVQATGAPGTTARKAFLAQVVGTIAPVTSPHSG